MLGKRRKIVPVIRKTVGIDGILNMRNLERVMLAHYSNHVKPHRALYIKITDVGAPRCQQTANLTIVYRLFRLPVHRSRARFHLHKDKYSLLCGNNINIAMAKTPITSHYIIALLYQITRCDILAHAPEFIVSCHTNYCFLLTFDSLPIATKKSHL